MTDFVSTIVLSVVVDFLFALLPWQFIWRLPIKRMEKLSVLVGLSLGIMCVSLYLPCIKKARLTVTLRAGAFGIKRTMQIQKLLSMKPLSKNAPFSTILQGRELTLCC